MTRALLSFHGNGITGIKEFEDDFNVIRLFSAKDPEAEIQAHKDDVVAINCSVGHKITRKLIESLPNLEIIATFSVGLDHIDLEAAKERGIRVTNTPDVLSAETADTGLALLLATAKHIVVDDMYVRVGKWLNGDPPLGTSLTNKKVGIVGLGAIGAKVASRCAAFEMDVSYYGPREKIDQPYTYYSDIEKMAADVDFLILTCPAVPETINLVDANILQALGPRGILINIARGSIVDEPALIKALQNGVIAGAGLDVFANEPHVPVELFPMDNVVLLPHIGSATKETRDKMGRLVIDNIKAHFKGGKLLTPVI
ncbi:MAG: 2-hydroxyacid dehydrogenase [Alphaproteobacteria bacterium]|nr:2-hydroxyacid dehydrogenase [Alphaproteobacteria bacterium]NCQ87932.1 2-hydroxyacid dehydrogenase [Alphaproteobacteria bacterium]NCT05561.1 2-hydroxyacid dehydrogenase [Alphaproteobacteria bacterium]